MKALLIPTLVFAGVLSAGAASIHNGLINYWTLDGNATDTAGSLAGNTSANATNGTIAGAAGAVSYTAGSGGLFGEAADFERDNGTDGRIGFADSSYGTDTDRSGLNLTISLWVNFESLATGWQALVAHGEGNDYRVARHGDEPGMAYAGGTGDITSGTNISSGWHHIVATTTHGGGVALYVDNGVPITGAGPAGIVQQDIAELWIGNNPGSTGRMHDGLIDDVAMWDRVLSAAEVDEIYNAGLQGTSLGQIPEPGVSLLAGLAGLGLLLRRRK